MARKDIPLQESPWKFVRTQDGSPSLVLSSEIGVEEWMHNSFGAFEESVFIYGAALEKAFEWHLPRYEVFSLGLGLAYNEFIAASLALKLGTSSSVFIESYETVAPLREFIVNYLERRSVPEGFQHAYDWIAEACTKRFEIQRQELLSLLLEWKQSNQWQIKEGFHPSNFQSCTRFHVFLYDAFSRKMNPELWTEESLQKFLLDHSQIPAIFATYAATGALNRALKANEFVLLDQPGFAGKRQSTMAIRTQHPKI
ncbi:MAG: hypothetical protein KDD22_03790 [Bdellovibrionales bacterium]|nr:hypothetical protein [Bdellovibrionales bacterium]